MRELELSTPSYFQGPTIPLSGDFSFAGLIRIETQFGSRTLWGQWFTGQQSVRIYYNISGYWVMNISNDGTATTSVNGTSSGASSNGVWYFVCARHNDGVDIEINKTAISDAGRFQTWDSTAHTTGVNSSAIASSIGSSYGGASSLGMDGHADEIGIYNRALTDEEFDWLFLEYKAGRSLY